MKLEKFKKMDKQKKIVIVSIVGILLIIGSVILYKSYALYEEKKEFNVLRGKVPDFGYDIKMVSILVDGEKQDAIPEKNEYYQVKVSCDKGTGEWDYKNWKLSLSDFEKETKCNVTFTTIEEAINSSSSEVYIEKTYLNYIGKAVGELANKVTGAITIPNDCKEGYFMIVTSKTFSSGVSSGTASFTNFSFSGEGIVSYEVVSQPISNNLSNAIIKCKFTPGEVVMITLNINTSVSLNYVNSIPIVIVY